MRAERVDKTQISRPSDGEHHLAGHPPVLQEAKRILGPSQREGPVECWRYFAGLYQRGELLQVGGTDQSEEHFQPLADEG